MDWSAAVVASRSGRYTLTAPLYEAVRPGQHIGKGDHQIAYSQGHDAGIVRGSQCG